VVPELPSRAEEDPEFNDLEIPLGGAPRRFGFESKG
jgi:hypothetical protein